MFRPKNIMLLILFIFYQTFLAEFVFNSEGCSPKPLLSSRLFFNSGTPYTSINTSQSQYANQTFLLEFFIFGGRPSEAPLSIRIFYFRGETPRSPPFLFEFFIFGGRPPRNPLFIAMAEKHCSVNNQSL